MGHRMDHPGHAPPNTVAATLRERWRMYPDRFDYLAPRTLDEALDVLAERGDEVKVLAGGQSLIPLMKLRFVRPESLVDINHLPDLDAIEVANGHVRVQALARHAAIAGSEVVARENHVMASAAPWVADPLVRNRGTLCGSLAHHDPEGDWASVLLACGADVVCESRDGGQRVLPVEDFLTGMFETALEPTELVVEVRVPRYSRGGGDYQKLERKIGDYATVGVATHLELGDDGTITKAGVALTSVYPHNLKVTDAEALLVGNAPGDELFAEAARVAAAACDPSSDVRGTAEYKRAVVDAFVRRSLANSAAAAEAS